MKLTSLIRILESFALLVLLPLSAHAVTLNPTADSYVQSGISQTVNFGGAPTMDIRLTTDGSSTRNAYLKFNLSGVSRIVSGKLRLYGNYTSTRSVVSEIWSSSDTTWTAAGITWKNKPPANALLATGTWATTAQWHEWDITQFLQAEKSAGRDLVSLIVLNTTPTPVRCVVNSKEATSFKPKLLIVTSTNTAPTISNIANRTINEDGTTGQVSFTVGDAETAAGSLTMTGSSSNTTLVPKGNIVFGGAGANRTVTVTPVANKFGTATITLGVSDGASTTNATFLLTVAAINDPPMAENQSVSTPQDAAKTITLMASDVENNPLSYTVLNNPTHGVLSNPNGATRLYTPSPGFTGPDEFTFMVNDGTVESAPATVSITVVATPPTFRITAPRINQVLSDSTSTIPITTNATDAIGGATVDFMDGRTLIGTAAGAPYNVDWNIANVADGVHQLTAAATDLAGKTSTAQVEVVVNKTTNRYLANKLRGVINVDGKLDESEWSMSVTAPKLVAGASPDNTVAFGALWDKNFLYVGIRVLDPNLVNDTPDATPPTVSQDDSVELYLNANHVKGTYDVRFDRHFAIGYNDNNVFFEKNGKIEGVQSMTRRSPTAIRLN